MPEIVITRIPRFSRAVRLMNEDGVTFHTSFNVSPRKWGRVLVVSSLQTTTKVPGIYWWREQAAQRFPRAEKVIYQRMTEQGLVEHEWPIRPPRLTYWQRAAACLRAYYGFPR